MIQELTEYSEDTEARAAEPSLVESFSIHGLYGYRTLSIKSPTAATILIARNGAGKTTLLNALYATLTGQFSRLQPLDFQEIRCKLRGDQGELHIYKSDIAEYFDVAPDGEVVRWARRLEIEPTTFQRFLLEDFIRLSADYEVQAEHPIYSKLQRAVGYRSDEIKRTYQKLIDSVEIKSKRLARVQRLIRQATKDVEIVYLPTYRRIELPLSSDADENALRRRSVPSSRHFENSLLAGEMKFGLSDISKSLADIAQRILIESNYNYRKITADILAELIAGDLDGIPQYSDELPEPSELELFFSRLEDARRVGPFMGDVDIPNIGSIYETINRKTDSGKFLRYFLGKLNTVIRNIRDMESGVQDFIDKCNQYLSSQDATTSIDGQGNRPSRPSPDDKNLRLNRRNLKVHAESVIEGRKISLNALSSGEKQMVSLFAKMYLSGNKKIVLIDEPELSLSLGWQRKILVDVLKAPSCSQIVSITHSPFVFDNELGPFAKSLEVSINLSALPEGIEEEDDEL